MKHSLKYLIMAMAIVPFFTSCEEDPEVVVEPINMGAATITFTNAADITVEEAQLSEPITGTIVADEADAVIASISIDAYTSVNEAAVNIFKMADLEQDENGGYSFAITTDNVKNIIDVITKIEVTATVVDGESSKESISIAVTPWEFLSAPKDFKWERIAGDPANLTQFGLAWTSNGLTGANAIITIDKDTKMYELSSNAWTTVTTVEKLQAAIKAATGITEYRGISTQAGANYDVVLAVDKGGVGDYYIINITKCTITNVSGSYTFSITGEYKGKIFNGED